MSSYFYFQLITQVKKKCMIGFIILNSLNHLSSPKKDNLWKQLESYPVKKILFNPFVPSVHKRAHIAKISILKQENISYQRRVYESVEDRSLS